MNQYPEIRKGGLEELVHRLEKEKLVKRDLVVPAKNISFEAGNFFVDDLPEDVVSEADLNSLLGDFDISTSNNRIPFQATETAFNQTCDKLQIPRRFAKRLDDQHPDMLDYNFSQLFSRHDKNILLRTFAPTEGSDGSGILRALLSDRYGIVDNIDVLIGVLKSVKETDANVEVGKCNLTESRMYIEFIRPESRITAEEFLNKYDAPDSGSDGDPADPFIYSGFVVSNSEVGLGRYKITPRAIVGACDNGLIFKRDAMSKTHLGSQMDTGIKWSHETKRKELELITSQIKDAVTHFMDEDFLREKFSELQQFNKRLKNPTVAVENLSAHLGITDEEKGNILNYFIDGGDFSANGAVQAVTYHAHEVESADKQYELEEAVMETLPNFYEKYDHQN